MAEVDRSISAICIGLLDKPHDQRIEGQKPNTKHQTQDERLRQIDKKVEQLFVFWKKHTDRLLDEARRDKK